MLNRRETITGALGLTLAATALPLQAQTRPTIAKLPLDFAANGWPILALTIAGKGPFSFLLDTGAFHAAIREPVARELGLNRSGTIRTQSLKGKEDSYLYVGTDIRLAGIMPLKRMTMVGLASLPSKEIDGVLPASFLTFLPTQLDFEASEMRYYLNDATMPLDGFSKVESFTEADGKGHAEKIYTIAALGGRKMTCVLDTGAASHLLLSSRFVTQHKLWDAFPDYRTGAAVGANGEALLTRLADARDFDLGPIHFDTVRVSMTDPKAHDSVSGRAIDAIIGVKTLNQFTLAFTDKKALYLKPNNRFDPARAEPL